MACFVSNSIAYLTAHVLRLGIDINWFRLSSIIHAAFVLSQYWILNIPYGVFFQSNLTHSTCFFTHPQYAYTKARRYLTD